MVEGFGGGVPAEGFAGSAVELGGDGGEVFGGVDGEVGAFGEVLAQEWSGPQKLDTVSKRPSCEGQTDVLGKHVESCRRRFGCRTV